jgi:ATP-binding protein involved in chromosome partitioning
MDGYGIKVMSIGFLIEPETAMIWRGPMVQSAITQMLREVAWGELDILVVDMPPGTGDAQLTMAQATPLSGAVIVSTPQDLALIDATRAIDLFRKMNVPIFGLVENMSGYACPHCGEISDPFGAGGAEAAAKVMSIPFLGRVPLTLNIRRSSDEGTPPATGEGEEAAAFRRIASRLLEEMNPIRI